MSTPIFIQNQKSFEGVAEALGKVDAFAIDTEFDNNHYAYGFTLCLIQIATADTCYLIDPFEVKDLSRLWLILENSAIEKVLHDCGEDMRLFYLHGCSPKNIFDTSIATKLLGFEKIGLGSVLSEVLEIEFSKQKQQSNWLKRPLTSQQLEYAANDVRHLLALRDTLTLELRSKNRWEWFMQSMAFLEHKNFAPKAKDSFLTTKDLKLFNPFEQYVLNELYRFRDSQAQRIGKPVYQVIIENIIHQAIQNAAILDDWTNLKGIHYKLQNPAIAAQLKGVLEEATQRAIELNIPVKKPRPTPQQLKEMQLRAERSNTLKNEIFLPIKRWLEEKYGILLTPIY
ncbi:MAG: ribonuclease D [Spirosomataceae bacterium]